MPLNGCSISAQIERFAKFGLHLIYATGRDALFEHESLSGFKSTRDALDEFRFYRQSSVQQPKRVWPDSYFREWFFSEHKEASLRRIHRNITALLRQAPGTKLDWTLKLL